MRIVFQFQDRRSLSIASRWIRMSLTGSAHLFEHLRLSREDIDDALRKRMARIAEAIAWEGGTQEQKRKYTIWAGGQFEVSLQKPGKEAAPDWKRLNVNDMLPV